jgi:hypothetical protein
MYACPLFNGKKARQHFSKALMLRPGMDILPTVTSTLATIVCGHPVYIKTPAA